MTKCPVCNTEFSDHLCPGCGYDRSRDYTQFPTFAPLPAAMAAPRRQEEQKKPQEDVIRCGKCGGTSFSLQAGTMLPVCRRCGTVFTPPQPEQPRKEPKAPAEKPNAPEPKKLPKFQFKKQPEPSTASADQKKATPGFKKLFAQKAGQPAAPSGEIISITGGFDHTAVLYGNGTVRAVGSNEFGQCDTNGWSDIHTVAAARGITLGLDTSGFVHTACNHPTLQSTVQSWENVAAIAVCPTMAAAIHEDGTISLAGDTTPLASMPKVRNPGGQIALGHRHLVLLSPKGTVAAFGDNAEGQCNVSKWTDIVAIAAGEAHTVGLKRDGTVVATGRNKDGQCRAVTFLSPWKNITAIAAGDNHTVALRKDGTVLCCGSTSFGKCDTRTWTNAKSIAAGTLSTLALTKDGKILAAGWQTEDLPVSLMQHL